MNLPLDSMNLPLDSMNLDIELPAFDRRTYHPFKLANGMRCLVISDPDTDEASAALDVRVGSMADPPDYPGLAHFLEHMLFMGTKKYPAVDHYSNMIAKGGGSSNAYTSKSNTHYFFTCTPKNLFNIMEVFSQFFVAPLLNPEYVKKERNAVHSEHIKNRQRDVRKMLLVLRHHMLPNHPYNRFATGDKDTLGDEGVVEALNAFYRQWYTAPLMSVCVLGRESIEDLEAMVYRLFKDVPGHPATPIACTFPLYDELKGGTVVEMQSINDAKTVLIFWDVPHELCHYTNKSSMYVETWFNHRGSGSVTAQLKRKGLAHSAYLSFDDPVDEVVSVQVQVDATARGMQRVPTILEIVFDFLAYLATATPKPWLHDELQQLQRTAFRYSDPVGAQSLVSHAASHLRLLPYQHLVSAPTCFEPFSQKNIRALAELLSQERSHVIVMKKELSKPAKHQGGGAAPLLEPLLCTHYRVLGSIGRRRASTTSWSFPEPNQFVPKLFDVLASPSWAGEKTVRQLSTRNNTSLWYAPECVVVGTPKVGVIVSIRTKTSGKTPRDAVLNDLLVTVVEQLMEHQITQAADASTSFVLQNSGVKGIELSSIGFWEAQVRLCNVFKNTFFRGTLPTKMVQDALELLTSSYANAQHAAAHGLALSKWKECVFPLKFSTQALLEVCNQLKANPLAALVAYRKEAYRAVLVEALVEGNVLPRGAEELVNACVPSKVHRLDPSHRHQHASVLPNPGMYWIQTLVPKNQSHAVLLGCCLGPSSLRCSAYALLLEGILYKQCFSQLRTQEQLGYVVYLNTVNMSGVTWLRVCVQSASHPVQHVLSRIQKFVDSIPERLRHLSPKEFRTTQRSTISTLNASDTRMAEALQRHWSEISTNQLRFDRSRRLSEHVFQATQAHLGDWVQPKIQRCRLVSIIHGKGSSRLKTPNRVQEITQPTAFHRQHPRGPTKW